MLNTSNQKLFFEKKMLFKNASESTSLRLQTDPGNVVSTDGMFLQDSMVGVATIDTQIDRLDRLIRDPDLLIKYGLVPATGVAGLGTSLAYIPQVSSLGMWGAGLGVAPFLGAYGLYKGSRWAIDAERHDEALSPVISKMEAGVSLEHGAIQKTGFLNKFKEFFGAESKLSIETYARVMEDEVIVNELIRMRDELHAKKLAQLEATKSIHRGWASRAKHWFLGVFKKNAEMMKYTKSKNALERETKRVAQRKNEVEEQINKTKAGFEKEVNIYEERFNSLIKQFSEFTHITLDMEEWKRHVFLEHGNMPACFEVNGEEYDSMDDFISRSPDLNVHVRAPLRYFLKEIRRVGNKIRKLSRNFGNQNFSAFEQRHVSEYVSEKRDVMYKVDVLEQSVGRNVSIDSVSSEISAEFSNMRLPLTGFVKDKRNGNINLALKDANNQEFSISIPLKSFVRNNKDFIVRSGSGAMMKTSVFPLILLESLGVEVSGIHVDTPISDYENGLLPIMNDLVDSEFHNIDINLNPVLRSILSRKLRLSQREIANIGRFRVSKLSVYGNPGTPGTPGTSTTPATPGKIVLESLTNARGNRHIFLEIPLTPDNKIDKSKAIKVRRMDQRRAISGSDYEAEISFADFLVKNETPQIETLRRYKDFLVIKDYLLNTANVDKEVQVRNVPHAVALGYFNHTRNVYNHAGLGNFTISAGGNIESAEFKITGISADTKATSEIDVNLLTTGATTSPTVKIKAIDLVDFGLHQV